MTDELEIARRHRNSTARAREKREARMAARHTMADISFSPPYVSCSCGWAHEGPTEQAWKDHKTSVGEGNKR